jgi:ammonium transporter, Amt family
MMTIPGLALFYAGMVRKKNVLATMAQSLAATALVSILRGTEPGWDRPTGCSCAVWKWTPSARWLKRFPKPLFMLYQMTFTIITVAAGSGCGFPLS